MEKKKIRMRCWIEIDGSRFFSPGRMGLMELVDEEGSLARAAERMGILQKGWDMVNDLNQRGRPLCAPS